MSFLHSSFVRAALAFAVVAPLGLAVSLPSAFAADASFNGEAISTLGDASKLTLTATRASGTGSFVFANKLDAIGEDTSHALSFTLKEGGSLTFVAYADPSLGQGLEFVFTREGRALKSFVRKAGDDASALDFSAELSNVNASRVINLQIDVHDGESPAHLIVWDGLEGDFHDDNALLNTEETGGSPGNGEGLRRGVVLKDATLLKAVVSKAKFHHHH
ncbi:MAG: hypothetical protein IOD12_15680 [Silvanigrellales bacterium]|jgi:hypothetical protein|nr:hypothetical protein [Silvanigrellales bacterium]